jgi:hypothetical protein
MLYATQALTILAPIDPARRAQLEQRLGAIAADLHHNTVFRPRELPDTHFMRFVIVDDRELTPLLAWECNHDGDERTYLDEVGRVTPSIDRIFECCVDYPEPNRRDEARLSWLLDHSVRAAAFYTGYRGVPYAQVQNDRRVHDAIREALDRPDGRDELAGLPHTEIQRRLCEHVRMKHPELDCSVQDDGELRWAVGKLLAIIALILLLPVLLVIALPWYLVLRSKERADEPEPNTRPVHDDKGLAALEDKVAQNQLTHVVDIKPGWFRLATLWIVLTAIDVIARVYSVHGHLGGITSIHFARWVIVPDKRRGVAKRHRLLFFSNYDGSWESYLGEFIDRAAFGLTAVWSNTVGFPRTEHLLGAGARDEEAFKQWTRRHQIATQVWWSGVPDSTVQNVRDDVWIRRNLDRGLGDKDVISWLGRL